MHAGDDVQEGEKVLTKGTRLRPQEIGLLAAGGGLDHALFFQKLPLDLTGVAFGRNGHRDHPFCILRSVLLLSGGDCQTDGV